jgi:hypothetical protein
MGYNYSRGEHVLAEKIFYKNVNSGTNVHITLNTATYFVSHNLLYAEWERLKGNEGRERTGRKREKRGYKGERKITEVEKKEQ